MGLIGGRVLLAVVLLTGACSAADRSIKAVPDELEVDPFYSKYVDAGGIAIVSSERVADAALLRVAELIDKMLADRADVRKAMVEAQVRFIIIGADEETTDIPEYSHMRPKKYWNWRARGFGGRVVSCGEENVLCYPVDRYDDESIMIHEFAHTMHGYGFKRADEGFEPRLKRLYEKAIAKGLWKGTYAASNFSEYWAEGVQSYYDANRQNNYNHNHVDTRRELRQYDPDLYEFIAAGFNHSGATDWRYEPVAVQPKVTAPPDKGGYDGWYKKYVRAKGLAVLGSERADDEALMEANNIVRRMFAYRYDMLKDMIEAGLIVVVLADGEDVSDVPEVGKDVAGKRRTLGCTVKRKVIVVGQENLLRRERDRHEGESVLVGQLAQAVHVLLGRRPVDLDYEGRTKQQYELGLQRMDERFDKRLESLYEAAMSKGLWTDTRAAKNYRLYWIEAVQSWFDANKEGGPGHNRVNTREELQQYDPELAKLVADVFRHGVREDWRWGK